MATEPRTMVKIRKSAEEHGWTLTLAQEEDRLDATLTRGEETISMFWLNGAMSEGPVYRLASVREVRLRNAGAAINQMFRKPDYKARTRKATPGRRNPVVDPAEADPEASEGAVPETAAPGTLPFDPATSSDEEVLAAVYGKLLVWVNPLIVDPRERYQQCRVLPLKVRKHVPGVGMAPMAASKNTKISTCADGRRVLTFAAEGEGFRSVALDRILQVS